MSFHHSRAWYLSGALKSIFTLPKLPASPLQRDKLKKLHSSHALLPGHRTVLPLAPHPLLLLRQGTSSCSSIFRLTSRRASCRSFAANWALERHYCFLRYWEKLTYSPDNCSVLDLHPTHLPPFLKSFRVRMNGSFRGVAPMFHR